MDFLSGYGFIRVPFALGMVYLAQAHAAQPADPVLPEVRVHGAAWADPLLAAPSAIGRPVRLDLERSGGAVVRIDEALVETGAAYWDAGNSLGLAAGLGLRGFTLSQQGSQQLQGARTYLNGHADIAWRFARDPATVSRVEVVLGHDATLLGAGSPGGAVQYLSKEPTGAEFHRVDARASSVGGVRGVLDGESHWGPVQVRTVLAVQRGERTVEDVADDRNALLVSTRFPWSSGELKLDLEHHGNAMPFPFGTAYTGGRFWLDRSYVDGRAHARRHYRRHALYLQQQLTGTTDVHMHLQDAASSRAETLLGFFDPLNATQLRGYYRLIDERNAQRDFGARLQGRGVVGDWKHQWVVAWTQHLQKRNFSGPQSIGAFTLDLENPVFPRDLTAIGLSPRFASESYRERGLGTAGVLEAGRWEWRIGARRSGLTADSSSNPSLPQVRSASAGHTTASVAAGWRPTTAQRVWLSRSESFQPNRGQLSGGAHLPPSQGRQWEAGWQLRDGPSEVALQVFDVLQTHLPARDPRDRDAFVLMGASRSTGVTGSAQWRYGLLEIGGALTFQRARIQSPTSAGQGVNLVGVPARFGGVAVGLRSGAGTWSVRVQGAGSLPGDSQGSFRAPGYGVLNLGWSSRESDGLRWGVRLDNALDRRYVRALTGPDNAWQGDRRKSTAWLEWSL